MPAGLAIGTPADRQRPARQLLARVPLALAEVQEATGAVAVAQLVGQALGQATLGGAQRVGVPFGAVAVVDADEGGLTAHGQAHVVLHQLAVHLVAQRQHLLPLVVGVGHGHARRLVDARDLHVVLEGHLALVHRAFHRGGAGRLRGAGHRDVAFAGQQAGGGVQADPAGAGQEHLAPGVQVGEVDFGAAGAVERLDVGLELDEVARDEARGQAHVAQHLHQQPAGVAAGAAAQRQRFFGRLHAGLQPHQVADVVLQPLVDAHQEVDGPLLGARDAVDQRLEARRQLALGQVGRQVVLGAGGVLEREVLGLGFEEEVERVVDRHLGDQVDGDGEFGGFLGEDQAGQVVGERVLLPVVEVLHRLHAQRVAQDGGAAVRRGPQADDLGRQADATVVAVARDVVEGDVNGHEQFLFSTSGAMQLPRHQGDGGNRRQNCGDD